MCECGQGNKEWASVQQCDQPAKRLYDTDVLIRNGRTLSAAQGVAAAPPTNPQIIERIQVLEGSIGILQDVKERLYQRLEYVLGPSSPSPAGTRTGVPTQAPAPLASKIDSLNDVVNDITDSIRALISRLQV